jgi:hypothetical protein
MTGIIVAQQWEEFIVGTRCATVTSGHISETMAYVMWREVHLWNVSVLRGVHLSNLVRSFLFSANMDQAKLLGILELAVTNVRPSLPEYRSIILMQ